MNRKEVSRTKTRRAAALALTLPVLFALALSCTSREDRALRGLPERDRGALYARTVETLRGVCIGREAGGLDEFCQKQAEFVTHFPECKNACQDLARNFWPKATR